jgi:D-amino-acid oxidase
LPAGLFLDLTRGSVDGLLARIDLAGGDLTAPHDWNLQPDLELALAIIARCAEVEPRLREAPVIGHRVGLRPTRPEIRVEAVRLPNTLLIHNYGHGGAGVTLSWGCAAEITTLTLGEA